jgi:ABC-type nitrate/sulfonate/bicarbonate transport system substrate-binding protein
VKKSLAVVIVLAGALAACKGKPATGPAPAGYELSELRYQGYSETVTVPELAEDLGYLAPLKLRHVGNTIGGPQDIQTAVTGDVDFGGAFNGAIAKLIAARAPIRAVVGYYGVDAKIWSGFYVLAGSAIRSARDLIGKKVAMNTLGAHSEFVLREYLRRGGLSAEEAAQVTLVVVPAPSSEQVLRARQVEVAVLGQIFREKALERGGLRSLFSDHELYGAFTAGSYVMREDFLRDKPRAARKFVDAIARAIEWTRATPEAEVIARMQRIISQRQRNEDGSAIKYWRSLGVAGKGGLIDDSEFQVWLDCLVRDGQLRPHQIELRAIYTNDLNPFSPGRS